MLGRARPAVAHPAPTRRARGSGRSGRFRTPGRDLARSTATSFGCTAGGLLAVSSRFALAQDPAPYRASLRTRGRCRRPRPAVGGETGVHETVFYEVAVREGIGVQLKSPVTVTGR